jgi:hypothetical protein
MANRLLLSVVFGLFFFQIIFSVFYSSKIIDQNNLYKKLTSHYQIIRQTNQELEIRYAEKFSIKHEPTTN